MSTVKQIGNSTQKPKINEQALTDDLSADDIRQAAGILSEQMQLVINTYDLTGIQLAEAIRLALMEVVPDERLFAAIDAEPSSTHYLDNETITPSLDGK